MKKRTQHPRGTSIDGFSPTTSHPNYAVWYGMKSRCSNPNHHKYKSYGAKGVTYCESWEHFANFCRDMGVRPSPQHSIDRIDGNGNYCPDNCRWATASEQCCNRGKFSNNKTGVTGVYEIQPGKFRAYYNKNGVRHNAPGVFESVELAALARAALIERLSCGNA